MRRTIMTRTALHMVGDCARCGHSIIYHAVLIGCMKCSCEEFE